MINKLYQHQIAQLRNGGYLDEANTIQKLSTQMNTVAEFDYLKKFAGGDNFDSQLLRDQLRALWTAYCCHTGFVVDTAAYDSHLRELWDVIDTKYEICVSNWSNFEEFDGFMCAYLV